jgi:hypothetical protein
MGLYYFIKIMCCFKRTVNALKTNKYFITNGKNLLAENEQLSDTIGEMQLQLENKFEASEVTGNASTRSNQEVIRVEYFTIEEELAEETELIRVKNKSKKRKMPTSPTPLQQHRGVSEPLQQKIKRYQPLRGMV